MKIKSILTPEWFAAGFLEGKNVEEIVGHHCSRSRGYQILNDYKRDYPHLFPSKPEITKEKLAEYLQRHTFGQTAAHFEVSVNTIRKRMTEFGLKKATFEEKITEDVLRKSVSAGEKDADIARRYACSVHTVMKLRYKYGIYRRLRPRKEN